MADEDNIKEEQDEESSGGKKKKIIYILAGLIGVVIFLSATFMISWFVVQSVKDEQVGKATETAADERVRKDDPLHTQALSAEPINFNLKPDERGRSRLLQVNIVFAFKNRKVREEIEERQAQLKDIAVRYFGSRTAEEVSIERLDTVVKKDLLVEFKRALRGDIEDLYFSTYLLI